MREPGLEDFLERWERWYPGLPPVPHVLRREREEQWLRVHTLPARTGGARHWAEEAEVRSRYHALADHVLGPGAPCALLTLRTTDALTLAPPAFEALAEHDAVLAGQGLRRLTRLTSSPALEETFEGAQVWLYGARVLWVAGAWDALLRACDAGTVARVLWVELESGRAFSPFAGGADLFLPRARERAAAKLRFAPWLEAPAQK
jgi:hypothetical protein